ncbi:MAG TPA: ABC transporter ATP-binding protein [Acidimicrobiia bacterium]|jgi:ABC-2 type transport system ATP-binding protein|nr:ABC transporter ATP-binding protein [Acidimicrobiia bacterium]
MVDPISAAGSSSTPVVSFEGVEKRYGKLAALDRVDLEVPAGAVMGLIGPNGAGKTTSMLLMSSLLSRDAGSVRILGNDPEKDPRSVRKVIGYMPDFFGFYDTLNVSEYLDFFAATHGIKPHARPGVVADLLALVDLEGKADADVNTLSRGMKQRLSLARALVHDPQLLILDEPASGLDPRARVQLRELIAELARLGKTVVISSHILAELEGICTHMAVVDHGKVKAHGTLEEIRTTLVANKRVTVRVPDSQVDATEDALSGQPEVTEMAVERGVVRFLLNGDDAVSARLLGQIVGGGIEISEWRVDSAGLEELFLQITEERRE